VIDSKQRFIVEFDPSVINTFRKYQQKNGESESGGILVGEIYPLANKVIIKEAIVSLKAKRSFFGVNIDKVEMQQELDKCRENSKFTYYYLGDWHTHPESHPHPSFIDTISYNQTCKKAKLVTNFIIFLIIGNSENIEKDLWMEIRYI
jgi:integrative and conjugative element protein (TIGR02256 family)